jgi:predicted enzyme related to lactoylglutathione lyase
MTLNHLNLVVPNLSRAVSFFETYFEFRCEGIKGNNLIAVLKNKADFTLVVMTDKNGDTTYPNDFHIGFMLERLEEVDMLHQKLVSGKIDMPQAPRKIRDSYGFYFYFDNLFIEVGHYVNQSIGLMEKG